MQPSSSLTASQSDECPEDSIVLENEGNQLDDGQSLRRVTIAHACNAKPAIIVGTNTSSDKPPPYYVLGLKSFRYVETIANVFEISDKTSGKIQFDLRDDTGKIKGWVWDSEKKHLAEYGSAMKEPNYVHVIGELESYKGRNSIKILKIRPLNDVHEVYHHLLRVLWDIKEISRSAPTPARVQEPRASQVNNTEPIGRSSKSTAALALAAQTQRSQPAAAEAPIAPREKTVDPSRSQGVPSTAQVSDEDPPQASASRHSTPRKSTKKAQPVERRRPTTPPVEVIPPPSTTVDAGTEQRDSPPRAPQPMTPKSRPPAQPKPVITALSEDGSIPSTSTITPQRISRETRSSKSIASTPLKSSKSRGSESVPIPSPATQQKTRPPATIHTTLARGTAIGEVQTVQRLMLAYLSRHQHETVDGCHLLDIVDSVALAQKSKGKEPSSPEVFEDALTDLASEGYIYSTKDDMHFMRTI